MIVRICLLIGLFSALSACAVAPEGVEVHDPYEEQNRRIHAFNKDLDRAVLRPVGRIAAAAPIEVREPIANFAANSSLPGMVLNGVLQGDLGGAATNTMRFLLNSTLGLAGLFDPAGDVGLDASPTDFGETLAVWGFAEGAYIEAPVFGPTTQRDRAGGIIDFLVDPLGQVGLAVQARYSLASKVADNVIYRGVFSETIDQVLYESADSYAQSRLIYLQNRRFELGLAAPGAYDDPYFDPYEDLQ